MTGAYDRFGNYHPDPAWRQSEDADDWTQADVEDIDFPDDHDQRFDDMYSDRTEILDGDIEPY